MEKSMLDKKRFIRQMKACVCLENRAGKYFLRGKTAGRGEDYYYYTSGENRIENQGGKSFYLSESAGETVRNAVAAYEKGICEIRRADNIAESEIDGVFSLFIRSERDKTYTYHVAFVSADKKRYTAFHQNASLRQMLGQIYIYSTVLDDAYDWVRRSLQNPDRVSLAHNPVYLAAVHGKDEYFCSRLKLHYGIAVKEE